MPSRYIHKEISKILTEKGCDRTHKAIDYPVRFLRRKHRIFFHDPISASLIGFLSDGYEGVYAGLSHIALDYCCTKLPALKTLTEVFIYLRKKKLL